MSLAMDETDQPRRRSRRRRRRSSDLLDDEVEAAMEDSAQESEENLPLMTTLLQCVDIHYENAAAYHRVYGELDNLKTQLEEALECIDLNWEDITEQIVLEEPSEVNELLQDTLETYNNWWPRLDRIKEKCANIVPLQYRTTSSEGNMPAVSLCDYIGQDISLRTNEQIIILDNTHEDDWLIINSHGRRGTVPAPCCLIPPPDTRSLSQANRLTQKLLSHWREIVSKIRRVVQVSRNEASKSNLKAIRHMKRSYLRLQQQLHKYHDLVNESENRDSLLQLSAPRSRLSSLSARSSDSEMTSPSDIRSMQRGVYSSGRGHSVSSIIKRFSHVADSDSSSTQLPRMRGTSSTNEITNDDVERNSDSTQRCSQQTRRDYRNGAVVLPETERVSHQQVRKGSSISTFEQGVNDDLEITSDLRKFSTGSIDSDARSTPTSVSALSSAISSQTATPTESSNETLSKDQDRISPFSRSEVNARCDLLPSVMQSGNAARLRRGHVCERTKGPSREQEYDSYSPTSDIQIGSHHERASKLVELQNIDSGEIENVNENDSKAHSSVNNSVSLDIKTETILENITSDIAFAVMKSDTQESELNKSTDRRHMRRYRSMPFESGAQESETSQLLANDKETTPKVESQKLSTDVTSPESTTSRRSRRRRTHPQRQVDAYSDGKIECSNELEQSREIVLSVANANGIATDGLTGEANRNKADKIMPSTTLVNQDEKDASQEISPPQTTNLVTSSAAISTESRPATVLSFAKEDTMGLWRDIHFPEIPDKTEAVESLSTNTHSEDITAHPIQQSAVAMLKTVAVEQKQSVLSKAINISLSRPRSATPTRRIVRKLSVERQTVSDPEGRCQGQGDSKNGNRSSSETRISNEEHKQTIAALDGERPAGAAIVEVFPARLVTKRRVTVATLNDEKPKEFENLTKRRMSATELDVAFTSLTIFDFESDSRNDKQTDVAQYEGSPVSSVEMGNASEPKPRKSDIDSTEFPCGPRQDPRLESSYEVQEQSIILHPEIPGKNGLIKSVIPEPEMAEENYEILEQGIVLPAEEFSDDYGTHTESSQLEYYETASSNISDKLEVDEFWSEEDSVAGHSAGKNQCHATYGGVDDTHVVEEIIVPSEGPSVTKTFNGYLRSGKGIPEVGKEVIPEHERIEHLDKLTILLNQNSKIADVMPSVEDEICTELKIFQKDKIQDQDECENAEVILKFKVGSDKVERHVINIKDIDHVAAAKNAAVDDDKQKKNHWEKVKALTTLIGVLKESDDAAHLEHNEIEIHEQCVKQTKLEKDRIVLMHAADREIILKETLGQSMVEMYEIPLQCDVRQDVTSSKQNKLEVGVEDDIAELHALVASDDEETIEDEVLEHCTEQMIYKNSDVRPLEAENKYENADVIYKSNAANQILERVVVMIGDIQGKPKEESAGKMFWEKARAVKEFAKFLRSTRLASEPDELIEEKFLDDDEVKFEPPCQETFLEMGVNTSRVGPDVEQALCTNSEHTEAMGLGEVSLDQKQGIRQSSTWYVAIAEPDDEVVPGSASDAVQESNGSQLEIGLAQSDPLLTVNSFENEIEAGKFSCETDVMATDTVVIESPLAVAECVVGREYDAVIAVTPHTGSFETVKDMVELEAEVETGLVQTTSDIVEPKLHTELDVLEVGTDNVDVCIAESHMDVDIIETSVLETENSVLESDCLNETHPFHENLPEFELELQPEISSPNNVSGFFTCFSPGLDKNHLLEPVSSLKYQDEYDLSLDSQKFSKKGEISSNESHHGDVKGSEFFQQDMPITNGSHDCGTNRDTVQHVATQFNEREEIYGAEPRGTVMRRRAIRLRRQTGTEDEIKATKGKDDSDLAVVTSTTEPIIIKFDDTPDQGDHNLEDAEEEVAHDLISSDSGSTLHVGTFDPNLASGRFADIDMLENREPNDEEGHQDFNIISSLKISDTISPDSVVHKSVPTPNIAPVNDGSYVTLAANDHVDVNNCYGNKTLQESTLKPVAALKSELEQRVEMSNEAVNSNEVLVESEEHSVELNREVCEDVSNANNSCVEEISMSEEHADLENDVTETETDKESDFGASLSEQQHCQDNDKGQDVSYNELETDTTQDDIIYQPFQRSTQTMSYDNDSQTWNNVSSVVEMEKTEPFSPFVPTDAEPFSRPRAYSSPSMMHLANMAGARPKIMQESVLPDREKTYMRSTLPLTPSQVQPPHGGDLVGLSPSQRARAMILMHEKERVESLRQIDPTVKISAAERARQMIAEYELKKVNAGLNLRTRTKSLDRATILNRVYTDHNPESQDHNTGRVTLEHMNLQNMETRGRVKRRLVVDSTGEENLGQKGPVTADIQPDDSPTSHDSEIPKPELQNPLYRTKSLDSAVFLSSAADFRCEDNEGELSTPEYGSGNLSSFERDDIEFEQEPPSSAPGFGPGGSFLLSRSRTRSLDGSTFLRSVSATPVEGYLARYGPNRYHSNERSPTVAPLRSRSYSSSNITPTLQNKTVEFCDSSFMTVDEMANKFRIESVVDPWGMTLSVAEAVQNGVIDMDAGKYMNAITGNSMNIETAIVKKLIVQRKFSIEDHRRLREEKYARSRQDSGGSRSTSPQRLFSPPSSPPAYRRSVSSPARPAFTPPVASPAPSPLSSHRRPPNVSRASGAVTNAYGLIHFNCHTHVVPCCIKSVANTLVGQSTSYEVAKRCGILDTQRNVLVDKKCGRRLTFDEAIEEGLMEVENETDCVFTGNDVRVNKESFLIYGVMDQAQQRRISFRDAIAQGIIDKDHGTYTDTCTNESFPIYEAINNECLKAKKVEAASLNLYGSMVEHSSVLELNREEFARTYVGSGQNMVELATGSFDMTI